MNCKLFISGGDQKRDIESMKNGCQIIVATPGKLNFLKKYSSDNLSDVKTLVLDEADMLMDPDFLSDIDEIISKLKNPQFEVYSATINKQVEFFLKKYFSADYVLTLNEKNSTSSTVKHFLVNTRHEAAFIFFILFYLLYLSIINAITTELILICGLK